MGVDKVKHCMCVLVLAWPFALFCFSLLVVVHCCTVIFFYAVWALFSGVIVLLVVFFKLVWVGLGLLVWHILTSLTESHVWEVYNK